MLSPFVAGVSVDIAKMLVVKPNGARSRDCVVNAILIFDGKTLRPRQLVTNDAINAADIGRLQS